MPRPRDPFSGLSHLVGAGLAGLGAVYLLFRSGGEPRAMLAFGVYGASLVTLYLASGLYHSVQARGRALERWRRFDHAAIYGLIAGTYVPVCLLALRGPAAGWMLAGQAVLAAVGVSLTLFLPRIPERLGVAFYLVMGWMALAALGEIRRDWPPSAVWLLVGGGLLYTVGAVVYATGRPRLWPGRFGAHDLWHLFVLGGSAAHFALVAGYVASRV